MIPASHPFAPLVKREPLSKWDFAMLMLAQQGRCQPCGRKLEKGKTRDEHLVALNLNGTNALSNRALWCLECVEVKNRFDKRLIAKSKRIRGETKTGPKRPIRSAPFRSDVKRRMDGKVVPK